MKKYAFYYHYNKPASKKAGYNVWTVHFKNQCIPVTHIRCNVVTETRNRNVQPHAIVWGKCSDVTITDNQANII